VGNSLAHDLATRARAAGRGRTAVAPGTGLDLDAVEGIFAARLEGPGTQAELIRCRARAGQLAAASGEISPAVALAYASDILVICAVERPWRPGPAQRIVSRLATLLGLAPEAVALQLFLGAVRAPQLLDLPPAVALETQLRLLVALAPVQEASLWTRDVTDRVGCLIAVGATTQTRRFRAVAARALEGTFTDSGTRGTIFGAPVMRWESPWSALVVRTRADSRETIAAYLAETVAAMSPVIERELVLQRGAAREQSLVRASERRLGRLAFDLHDTALQHIAALGADFYLFRRQLAEVVAEPGLAIASARVDDLEARAWELDRVLRELAHSLEPSSLVRRPLPRVITDEAAAFTERTGIEVRQRVNGDFAGMTVSQKIALIRIVQEALTNIREHANASRVRISIAARNGRIDARVEDNGIGFHVARTLLECAKRGRFGLVGSSERVRLLGGTFDVRSRPGGPTAVSVSLPRWQPLTAAQPRGDASAVPVLVAD
jgi:signal transduction histidine kinase